MTPRAVAVLRHGYRIARLSGYGSIVGQQLVEGLEVAVKGASPADLPIEQPTKFELVIDQWFRSGTTMARSGLRMLPTFPLPPYHCVRRVFPGAAGRLAFPAAPSRANQLKPAPGIP